MIALHIKGKNIRLINTIFFRIVVQCAMLSALTIVFFIKSEYTVSSATNGNVFSIPICMNNIVLNVCSLFNLINYLYSNALNSNEKYMLFVQFE